MGLEIERKFHGRRAPEWLEECDSAQIGQGYVALEGDTEVRVRSRGDDRSLTVKRGGGLVRAEVEVELAAEQFRAALAADRRAAGSRSAATSCPSPHRSFDVDVYDERAEPG